MLSKALKVGSLVLFSTIAVACTNDGTDELVGEDTAEVQAEIDTPWVKCTRPKDARGCTVYHAKDLTGLAWTWGLGTGFVPKGTVLTAAARAQGSYLVLGLNRDGKAEYNVEAPAGAVRVVDTTWTAEVGSDGAGKEWTRGRREPFTKSDPASSSFIAPAAPRPSSVDDAIDHLYCNDPGGCAIGYTHWLGRSAPLAKAACGEALPIVARSTAQNQYIVSTPILDVAESDARFGRVKVVPMNDGAWGKTPGECPGAQPDFVCETQGVFEAPPPNAAQSQLVGVRVGTHPTFDRFVMEFANAVPGFIVGRQDSATFEHGGNGAVQVAGQVGLNVITNPASGWKNGQPTFTGPTRLRGGDTLREAALVEDFAGTLAWGLGLSKAACFRVTKLDAPPRLVVDVKR